MKKTLITAFLPLALLAKPHITVYNAYSNLGKTYINGRLIKQEGAKVKKSDTAFMNFIHKIGLFFHNELKNREVFIYADNHIYSAKSDEEGYFKLTLNQTAEKIYVFTKSEPQKTEVKPLNFKNPPIGIISDFDDTLTVSDVKNRFKLLKNSLTKNYKQRILIKESAKKIKKLLKPNMPLIIVSGSPWQFYMPIKNFLKYNNFPKAIILLKQIHGKNMEPFDQFKYKTAKIEAVFKQFPRTKWYLFGDSGEKDADVYSYLKKKYPNKIISYFIRKVK